MVYIDANGVMHGCGFQPFPTFIGFVPIILIFLGIFIIQKKYNLKLIYLIPIIIVAIILSIYIWLFCFSLFTMAC